MRSGESSIVRVLALTLLAASALVSAPAAARQAAFVPVFQENFPDAFILPVGGEFIAYATNDGENVPMATSRDLVNWSFVRDAGGAKRDAMPQLAPWVKPGFTWAPEVAKVGGRYLLYYTANHRAQDKQCLGVAVASDPKGPFVDRSPQPLVCQFDLGGSIDANSFRDKDGKLYLYWKSDGNRIGKPSALFGVQLSTDGTALAGKPVDLKLGDREEWKQRVIEAPTMIRTPDGLALLYSGGYFGWNDNQRLSPYAMSFALCSGPLGPCREGGNRPLLASFNDPRELGCLSGPGHQSVFSAAGGSFISFHGWATSKSCRKASDKRYLFVAPFGWENGKPVIAPSLRPTGQAAAR
ncbi:MAG TPA: glycoside hydrolase family 43 protein [Sphingomicrobium sp.]|jgi:beta-xylosidase|nr:glycoside hydrolase family 43 protein [Sphingomicrobium sp.]